MPRATAASTMEPVLGPRRSSSSSSRSWAIAASAVEGVSSSGRGGDQRAAPARAPGGRPLPRCTRPRPGRRRARACAAVRLKVTGQPAWACSASAASSSTWASDTGPAWPVGRSAPMAGNSARSARLEAGQPGDGALPRRRSARSPRWRCGGSTGWGRAGRGCGRLPSVALSAVDRGAQRGWRIGYRCEGLDAGADQVGRDAQRPGGGHGGQQRRRASAPRRSRRPAACRPGSSVSLLPLASTQPVVAHEHGAAAAGPVRGDGRRAARRRA